MPLVDIQYNPNMVSEDIIVSVRNEMRHLVTEYLGCNDTDGGLSVFDVEAHVKTQGKLDISRYDLEIMVFANHYPSRARNLNERTESILTELRDVVGERLIGIKYFVWVFLGHAEFADQELARIVD